MASEGIQLIEVTDDSIRMLRRYDHAVASDRARARRTEVVVAPPRRACLPGSRTGPQPATLMVMAISAFLADDNIIVREGVRALLAREKDLEIVGVAGDYDELIAGAEAANPQVLVTDIRMPPAFQSEGIDAAKELRKRHPGTGVVILSQYDDPEYAISLLQDGAAGYGYLLKDRIAEGNQLARAVREVATGGSVLDPKIVEALVHPVAGIGGLTVDEEALLQQVAQGRPIKAIASAQHTTPAPIPGAGEEPFIPLFEK